MILRPFVAGLAIAIALGALVTDGRAESLDDAWGIALRVNGQLQARQLESQAAGLNLGAARAARLPSIRTLDANTFLSQSPRIRTNFQPNLGVPGTAAGSSPTIGGTPSGFAGQPIPILGPNQHDVPFSFSYITIPLYSGGRIRRTIDSSGHQLNAQRSEEFRAALDLKLTVAEAYVGILRARKDLDVAQSDVARLASFARDVTNRKDQQLATRNEQLAAEVSLANARLREITAIKNLDTAWATYNRYLCRPLTTVVPLDELTTAPSGSAWTTWRPRRSAPRPSSPG